MGDTSVWSRLRVTVLTCSSANWVCAPPPMTPAMGTSPRRDREMEGERLARMGALSARGPDTVDSRDDALDVGDKPSLCRKFWPALGERLRVLRAGGPRWGTLMPCSPKRAP